jgi:Ser/Thr protein kinase RdoA (MazF antagonist)
LRFKVNQISLGSVSTPVLATPERLHAAGVADMTGLARAACARYGIPPDGRLHLYPLTENWTYRVEDGSGSPFVLRIYRPDGRSHDEIASELAWMTAIGAEFRTLVPAVVPTASGSQVLELTRDAPLGPFAEMRL